MRTRLKVFIFSLILSSSAAFAGTDQARVYAMGGFGSTATSGDITGSEGPLGFSFGVDYAMTSRWVIGAEHVRSFSMSPTGTSISFTGLSAKFYYPGGVPTRKIPAAEMTKDEMIVEGWFPYFGLSMGFGQASLPSNDEGESPNAGGIYLGIRSGVDHPFTRNFGMRGELTVSQSIVATGSLSSMLLSFGFYYFM